MDPITQSASEVARLRAALEQETIAMQRGLSGLAGVARHTFITARLRRVEQFYGELATHIGEEKCTAILCAVFEQHTP